MNIVKIIELKNIMIKNNHNNTVFGKQNVLKVIYEDGSIRYLDKLANRDITDMNNLEIIRQRNTKEKIIFQDELSVI